MIVRPSSLFPRPGNSFRTRFVTWSSLVVLKQARAVRPALPSLSPILCLRICDLFMAQKCILHVLLIAFMILCKVFTSACFVILLLFPYVASSRTVAGFQRVVLATARFTGSSRRERGGTYLSLVWRRCLWMQAAAAM